MNYKLGMKSSAGLLKNIILVIQMRYGKDEKLRIKEGGIVILW